LNLSSLIPLVRFMAVGQGTKLGEGAGNVVKKLRKNPVQFSLAIFLVMCCAATKKFQIFPMVWIAGNSKCTKEITTLPTAASAAGMTHVISGKSYMANSWIEVKPDCKEKAKVFTFVTESFTITTSYLVFFGVVKACFNFITGASCDKFGRKWTLVVGWILGIPMPFMVLAATGWWTVAFSNVFLGMQQALVWSATIFIMVDYLGQENSGAAIGINETIGYTTVAIITEVASYLMNEDEPRGTCYYVIIGLIFTNLVVAILFLKESKPIAVQEEADRTQRALTDIDSQKSTSLVWPSGRKSDIHVAKSAFIYTSFVNKSLMTICFAGLMINFISGFAWGLFKKWMKSDYEVDGELKWAALEKQEVANVVLCYGILKGTLQWIFGFLGDRFGRKWFVVSGLSVVMLGLVVVGAIGVTSSDPLVGFMVGALLMGTGTGIMYTNNLAAICDHSDPSWRSSALGAYRFWRDMGYAIGALVTGAMADGVGIPWSVAFTAMLTGLAALLVAIFYVEVPGSSATAAAPEAPKKVDDTVAEKEVMVASPEEAAKVTALPEAVEDVSPDMTI